VADQSVIANSCVERSDSALELRDQLIRTRTSEADGCGKGSAKGTQRNQDP
jgi:hypothetical protein